VAFSWLERIANRSQVQHVLLQRCDVGYVQIIRRHKYVLPYHTSAYKAYIYQTSSPFDSITAPDLPLLLAIHLTYNFCLI
jgi:hypothetical protein